ncbi:hypothetical protein ACM26V_14300 [Salipaludibacillus sp. HK11]|uniref:hypothetical protein n=1 Tax=Salipaludibacillus sp. HK11 TaxID=3394320 RepID=UPI0039FC685E
MNIIEMKYRKSWGRLQKAMVVTIILCSFLTLSACGADNDDPNTLDVMFFTELPLDLNDDIDAYFDSISDSDDKTVEVHMFLPSAEKLTIEMVAGDGDIYIVDDYMYNIIFDPVILHPLDSVVDGESARGGIDDKYFAIDEDTGDEHIYAVPLDNESQFLQDIQVNHSSSFIAVMMTDRYINQFGLELLEAIN